VTTRNYKTANTNTYREYNKEEGRWYIVTDLGCDNPKAARKNRHRVATEKYHWWDTYEQAVEENNIEFLDDLSDGNVPQVGKARR